MATTTPPRIEDLRTAGILADELVTIPAATHRLWRIHATDGTHVLPWNGFRTHGPLLRFDHHPRPRGDHPDYGIWYGASSPRGAFAEVFQGTPVIDRTDRVPYLSAFTLDRTLTLLDLGGFAGGTWPTRLGCNHSLDSGPHTQSQAWARSIHRAHPHLDGIAYRGKFAGELCVALFEPAADAFPTNPALSLPLSHIGLARRIDSAAVALGYHVV
ncbi:MULTISPECIES: RES family NAD+ phosphorylase [Rhodococcus]|uniref:RES family NAD+ phosphorylase n=1 Tax=Rhodococcus oxybenzonivorans TaxID=1990687 RepID=A0AAE5A626_9NOCA|nr:MULTISPECIES: RES family NAD+ phosphorylase [Rhodococcus]MDV7243456.1 RES family NAD+ phosphorylase [Rhodococcus oxybenzonivorans]MDV7265162.1 RES family NAD+ phosphorylase [Rhodococcus oxybenzonivorans]MDV7277432.1 RES family NAD+ phosphorylase [Rhodococcus oxybenzonivorans]MDV7335540.1 RES family NAD+ phosphorylase [Rhodococcus oxybenzonivorans]MDV7347144.1 RES family NAD+ phosphorylase [Rhodococcus oxybenzonivorans]